MLSTVWDAGLFGTVIQTPMLVKSLLMIAFSVWLPRMPFTCAEIKSHSCGNYAIPNIDFLRFRSRSNLIVYRTLPLVSGGSILGTAQVWDFQAMGIGARAISGTKGRRHGDPGGDPARSGAVRLLESEYASMQRQHSIA